MIEEKSLTSRELRALELSTELFEQIQSLHEDNGRLRTNNVELATAIHTIQGFVKQHILARQFPEIFSNWWVE